MSYLLIALSFTPFYLIGTIPTGYIIAKSAGVDISKHGSGNVGATNIGRVLGKKAGILTLLIDIGKGAIAVGLALLLNVGLWYSATAAFAVVLGHCISLPPLLKGGKGVATSLGALIALTPITALGVVVIFSSVFAWRRTVSLASISAAICAPLIAIFCGLPDQILYGIIPMATTLVIRHKDNLKRLALGTEPRTELKSSATPSPDQGTKD